MDYHISEFLRGDPLKKNLSSLLLLSTMRKRRQIEKYIADNEAELGLLW